MFFSLDNIWLWISVSLAAAVLFADIFGALTQGMLSKTVTVIAFPLHILLLSSLLVGGAELVLAVTVMIVSLLVYTATRAVRMELLRRREGRDDL